MNAVFLINAPFPYGAAYSSRARNIVKLLCSCGMHVHVIAPNVGKQNRNDKSDELSFLDYTLEYVEAPVNFLTLNGIKTSKPYIVALNQYIKKNQVDIIFSSSMVFVADEINKVAKKINVPYIIEQCEWFDATSFKGGKFNPFYREHIKRIEKKNKKTDGILAISRLFEEHYTNMNIPTIRIPTILDIGKIEYRIEKNESDTVHIVFAGNLGSGKEKLKPIFEALERVDMKSKKIELDIYGPSETDVLESIDGDRQLFEKAKKYVNIYGRIPQYDVEEKLRNADYSIFIRPKRRSSDAGFPTKLAESMSVGTPVITNNTGDVGMYLKNMKNGFLMNDGNVEEMICVLNRILAMEKKEYLMLRCEARKTAEEFFSYDVYKEAIEDIVKRVKG